MKYFNYHIIMKVLFFVFAAFWFGISANAQNVFVTGSGNATKYHYKNTCRGLSNSTTGIKAISEAKAKTMGLTPCKICSKSNTNTKLKTQDKTNSTSIPAKSVSPSLVLNKTELAKSKSGTKEQLIQHTGYTTSYNENWLQPNWVAWELTTEKVNGTAQRPRRKFEPDPLVKGKSCEHQDYTNSGYSRGHMAPAADMKWSEQAMNESFYLSNVCPQSAALNTSMWNRIEEKTRNLARSGSTLYICCGPIIETNHKMIGFNQVAVPTSFFKVLLRYVNGKWHGIGFVLPNEECKGGMFNYAMTIDEVEKLTGIDFFYNLPDDIEALVESSWHQKYWQ